MREKAKQLNLQEDRYGYLEPEKSKFEMNKRLDLNDLLKRMKDQKKDDKKTNTLILSGAAGVAAVVLIIIGIFY